MFFALVTGDFHDHLWDCDNNKIVWNLLIYWRKPQVPFGEISDTYSDKVNSVTFDLILIKNTFDPVVGQGHKGKYQ